MNCEENYELIRSRSSLSQMWCAGLTKIQRSTWKASLKYLLSFSQKAYIQSELVPELVCIMKVIIPDCQTQHSRRRMTTCAAVVFARVQ